MLACANGESSVAEHEAHLRELETARLEALVTADSLRLEQLHASDFELINPYGVRYSKSEYLGQVMSGQLDYSAWEAGDISVRLYDDAAVLRYEDLAFEVRFDGEVASKGRLSHTNLYERRDGVWQVVWSQASGGL